MNSWINFSILWMITGSPAAAAAILIAAYAIADWYTFGFLRGIAVAVADFRRGRRLRLTLLQNPHDKKARADLGEILVAQRRYARAIEVVKPLADADPHDLRALYLLGVACLATGRVEQGELFLQEVHRASPEFRDGEPLLQLARFRIRRNDRGALAPRERWPVAGGGGGGGGGAFTPAGAAPLPFVVGGAAGGAIGGGVAILFFALIGVMSDWLKGGAEDNLFGNLSLGVAGYGAIIGLVVLVAGVTAGTSRLTVHRTLRAME